MIAEPCRGHDAAQSTEFDGLQAAAPGRLARVVLQQIVDAMQAFIEADGQAGGGGELRHAVDIVTGNGLLKKIQPTPGNRFNVSKCLLEAVALIGIG